MKIYQIMIVACILLISGSVNHYRTDWIGPSKAGTISGQVLSVINDLPIGGAIVKVLKNGRTKISTTTDAKGFFSIPGITPGTYHVVAESWRYGSLTIESVPVYKGGEVTTHFILTPKYTVQ